MYGILHLTTGCNLRCRYCYAPAKTRETMTGDTARLAVDLLIAKSRGSACLGFFGGEPLLCFDAIRELVAYANDKAGRAGIKMHFRLATNGILFTEESLRFARDHNILFAVSLDGDQRAHDAQRRTAEGTGSFALIDAKLERILHHNPHTVFTSVVTPQTAGRLRKSVEYMWQRGIRYIVHLPDFTHPDWTPEAMKLLEQSYEELARFYVERMRAGSQMHLTLFDEKLKSHVRAPFELGESCDFGARKFSVAPDGRLFPCVQFVSDRPDAHDYCIGDVRNGFTARRQELIAENRRERPQCRGCAHLGRCANYCGCTNWQTTGELTGVAGILCAHERMLIPIVDAVGNELWSERNAAFLEKHYRDYDALFPYGFN